MFCGRKDAMSQNIVTPEHAPRSPITSAKSVPGDIRRVLGVYKPPQTHWVGDGFRVAEYMSVIPNATRLLSPFLLVDYHPMHEYVPTGERRGVGVHPHRGFETVSIAWRGSVAHHDSAGNGGIIGPGDVQWMTAGAGILHKEYHEAEYAKRGGPFHMAQLWVNLPKADKLTAPKYQSLLADQMGRVQLQGNGSYVRVIAGEYQGKFGPAETFTPVHLFDIYLERGSNAPFTFPASHNVALLVAKGQITINGTTTAEANDLVVFTNEGESLDITTGEGAHVLLFGGEPILDPVVQHGPFAMTSQQEILQAFADLRAGEFGQLDD